MPSTGPARLAARRRQWRTDETNSRITARPRLTRHGGRHRIPLHPLAEAGARVALAYVRDQHGIRSRRPLPRYLARTAFFFVAGRFCHLVEADMAGLRVLLQTSDRTMARSVFACGDWDPLLVGTVFEALDRLGVPYRGRTFVEVGANFGVYCLPAISEHGFGRAIAFEPEPTAFELLVANIERNGLVERISARQLALSAEPGEVRLSRGAGNAGDNRVIGALDGRELRGDTVVVRASTFDQQVAEGTIPLADLGLVWLDVQGHEGEVLLGAQSLLRAGVPVVLEYSSSMMAPSTRARLHELVAAHYSVFVDVGWSALSDRIRFQPARAIGDLVPAGRELETDLLFA